MAQSKSPSKRLSVHNSWEVLYWYLDGVEYDKWIRKVRIQTRKGTKEYNVKHFNRHSTIYDMGHTYSVTTHDYELKTTDGIIQFKASLSELMENKTYKVFLVQ